MIARTLPRLPPKAKLTFTSGSLRDLWGDEANAGAQLMVRARETERYAVMSNCKISGSQTTCVRRICCDEYHIIGQRPEYRGQGTQNLLSESRSLSRKYSCQGVVQVLEEIAGSRCLGCRDTTSVGHDKRLETR